MRLGMAIFGLAVSFSTAEVLASKKGLLHALKNSAREQQQRLFEKHASYFGPVTEVNGYVTRNKTPYFQVVTADNVKMIFNGELRLQGIETAPFIKTMAEVDAPEYRLNQAWVPNPNLPNTRGMSANDRLSAWVNWDPQIQQRVMIPGTRTVDVDAFLRIGSTPVDGPFIAISHRVERQLEPARLADGTWDNGGPIRIVEDLTRVQIPRSGSDRFVLGGARIERRNETQGFIYIVQDTGANRLQELRYPYVIEGKPATVRILATYMHRPVTRAELALDLPQRTTGTSAADGLFGD